MILHEELQVCCDDLEVFPVLGLGLHGAMTAISAPGGERIHAIVESENFPDVRIVVNGGQSASVRRNFFLCRSLYDGAEWDLESAENEEMVRRILDRKADERAACIAAAKAEQARQEKEILLARAELEAERTEKARKDSLDRLLVLVANRPERMDWGRVVHDLWMVRDEISREDDRKFIVDLAERHRKSWGFWFSARQVPWIGDVLTRLGRSVVR